MRPRCEAGAFYKTEGKKTTLVYRCQQLSDFQVVMNGEDLLMVLCADHAQDMGRLLVAGSPDVKMEYLTL